MSSGKIHENKLQVMADAIGNGDIERMRSVLKKCPDLLHAKSPETDARSWLHVAAGQGECAAAEILLDLGLPVDILDGASRTSLRLAAYTLSTDVVQLLLDRGADPNGCGGPSPLHAVVFQGSVCEETLDAILRAHPNLELRDARGYTPLMIASRDDTFVAVKKLLAAGADVFARHPSDGQTALDIASHRNFARIVSCLEDFIMAARARMAIDGATTDTGASLKPL